MTNERQRLEVTNSPGSGTFKLGFRDVWADTETPRHPAAGELQVYLQTIPTIGSGNVLVSKESNWVYLIDFQSELGEQNVPLLQVNYDNLPAPATVQITTVTEGSGPLDPAPAPITDPALQDAINEAFAVLQSLHRREASDYQQTDKDVQDALYKLYPYQTVQPKTVA